MFKPIEIDPYHGFYFLKSKKEATGPGDTIWFDVKSDGKLSLILCDGVSSSVSDSRSSQYAVEAISELVKSKRLLESLKKDMIITMEDLNQDLLAKNLCTTLCFYSGHKDENIIVNSGDSVFLIFDQDRNIVFYNNVYNLKHSSEGVFETPDGREHMLITCLGHYSSRYEVSTDVALPDSYEIITFSDGLLQYVDNMDDLFKMVDTMNDSRDEFMLPEKNADDVSLIYIKV